MLLRSARHVDGTYPATAYLRREVDRGRMLRLRRGIYLPTEVWLAAPPWIRFRISAASVAARSPEVIFCRETALALSGVPLRRSPDRVHIRTGYDSRLGVAKPHSMTGGASAATQQRACDDWAALNQQKRPDARAVFNGFPLSRHRSRVGFRRMRFNEGWENPMADSERALSATAPMAEAPYELALRDITVGDSDTRFSGGGLSEEVRVRVEPLDAALADVVPMMTFADAVIVLDAVLARQQKGSPLQTWPQRIDMARVDAWVGAGHSARAHMRWLLAREFADEAAESVGESYSRVVIHESGFEAPALQVWFDGVAGGDFAPGGPPERGRGIRVDFYWERLGIVGEFDGRVKYGRASEDLLSARYDSFTGEWAPSEARPASGGVQPVFRRGPEEALWAEKRREDRLRALGLQVVRWTWDDLTHPERLKAILSTAGVRRQEPPSSSAPYWPRPHPG